MNPLARRLGRIIRAALICYCGVVILLLFLENFLTFHPTRASQKWMPPPVPEVHDVEFTTADGVRLHGWWLLQPGAKGALLYSHGNAGNLSYRGPAMVELAQALGQSVLIYDYPGYGRSEGRPTERNCYAAGDAAYDWLVQSAGVAPPNVILYGKSLGGGVAVELATRRPHRALILIKTFASLPDLGQELYFWLPARWFMRNRFDNLAKIGQCQRPVFIAHGDCDGLIGYHHAERLFAAANEPKRLMCLPGCAHNAYLPDDCLKEMNAFLRQYAPVGDPVPAN